MGDLKVIGIIPARGGSKGVPLKNIRLLCGKPLLAYSIESALQSNKIDRIIVSTDHDQIASAAKQFGAEVMLRPPHLATDEARTEGALIHVVDELAKEKYFADIVLTLEPTSPFRTANIINECINVFKNSEADSVIGVTETRSNYGRIVNSRYEFLFPNQPRRRQERKPLYKEASTIYGTRVDTLRKKMSVLGDNLFALIVPEAEAIDINTPFDFQMAEFMMQNNQKGNAHD